MRTGALEAGMEALTTRAAQRCSPASRLSASLPTSELVEGRVKGKGRDVQGPLLYLLGKLLKLGQGLRG